MAEEDIQAGPGRVHAQALVPTIESSTADARHDRLFEALVANDRDLVGLLAYSFATLAFRDWRAAFAGRNRREATADELAAFRLGEESARRVADYRKLAEHALRDWDGTAAKPVRIPGIPGMPRQKADQKPVNAKEALGYLALLCLLVAVLAIIVNYAKGRFFAP